MDVEQKLHSLSNKIVEYIVDLGSEYIGSYYVFNVLEIRVI